MKKEKILESLNEKILSYQEKRQHTRGGDEEDKILRSYILAYMEVEEMIKTGNFHKFLNTPHHM